MSDAKLIEMMDVSKAKDDGGKEDGTSHGGPCDEQEWYSCGPE
jgi:hypothetical protein